MVSRRTFIKTLATAALLYPFSMAFASQSPDRSLNMYNIHTGESLDITYAVDGSYDVDALDKINYLLRCHYTDKVKTIDVGVLDLLCEIKDRIGTDEQIKIISGYRSPEYNEYLRSIGRHVAKNSYHMRGLAIDFTFPGFRNSKLSHVAKSFYAGGVGTYDEFVHIDTGPVRYW